MGRWCHSFWSPLVHAEAVGYWLQAISVVASSIKSKSVSSDMTKIAITQMCLDQRIDYCIDRFKYVLECPPWIYTNVRRKLVWLSDHRCGHTISWYILSIIYHNKMKQRDKEVLKSNGFERVAYNIMAISITNKNYSMSWCMTFLCRDHGLLILCCRVLQSTYYTPIPVVIVMLHVK